MLSRRALFSTPMIAAALVLSTAAAKAATSTTAKKKHKPIAKTAKATTRKQPARS